jgi:alkanesulfonate monooxygenase SsuD/methylene tetrahydromethanopterin reductase-like flavin-dependent oxidoreductase (luciferase family)
MLEFGVTVLPDPPYQRLIELTKLAEAQGFAYGWTYDSHVLWQESMPVMALLADQTSTIKLGHMVTNPAIRDPTVLASAYATLQDITNGRMIMGVGRGDSSVRYVGRKPMKVAAFEEALQMVKPFMNGKEVTWNDKQLQLKWVRPELPEIEMHVAGYGPKALAVAGRQGDGVIIQLADPDIIQWIMATARKAAEEAGRDPAALKCIVSAPSHISDDLADAN